MNILNTPTHITNKEKMQINLSMEDDKILTNQTQQLHSTLDSIIEDAVKIPGTPAWIVLCGYAIGETSLFCCFADAFVKEHGHGIILLITKKHIGVAHMYQHRFLKILVVEDDLMSALLRSNYIPQDRFELNKPMSPCWIDRGFRDSDGLKYLGQYPGRGGMSETDMTRFVLRLPWNSRLERPVISMSSENSAWEKGRQSGLRVGRSVLLCPINNSAPKFPSFFWQTIVVRLKELGMFVFTNVGGLTPFNGLETMPIPGSTPVNLSIDEVIPFAQFCGRIVTGGNGMSFLTMLGCQHNFNMTQLIPYSINQHEDHSSLGFRSASKSKGVEIRSSFQFLAPELCISASLNEYFLPYDGSPEELSRLALIVATQETDDPSCILRRESNGNDYSTEHSKWLRALS